MVKKKCNKKYYIKVTDSGFNISPSLNLIGIDAWLSKKKTFLELPLSWPEEPGGKEARTGRGAGTNIIILVNIKYSNICIPVNIKYYLERKMLGN